MKTQTKLDKFGRALLPKKARQIAGLGPGTVLHVEATESGIRLTRAEPEGRLVRKKNGILIWSGGKLPDGFDTVRFIQDMRDERIRQTLGLDKE